MRSKKPCSAGKPTFVIFMTLLLVSAIVPTQAQAQKFKVLHTFHGKDGASPEVALVRDASGNLYGTTVGGGAGKCSKYGCGTAFKLNESGKQVWLYSFQGKDGQAPDSPLLRDATGNLYGSAGGGNSECGGVGCGVLFRLSGSGKKEAVLYRFDGADGSSPNGLLAEDAEGDLYGVLATEPGDGAVYEMDKSGHETVLYTFSGGSDGGIPVGGVVRDSEGNLYGTTMYGGVGLALTASVAAAPKYKVLHSFGAGNDGSGPYAPVVLETDGELYGTTAGGGAYDGGTVFKLTPARAGWAESVLYSFGGTNGDGVGPYAGLAFDSFGNVYGTTTDGGAYSAGTVFELTPGSGGWSESSLYSFGENKGDGGRPYSGVVLDSAGNLYGVTSLAGKWLGGTAYELSSGSDGWNETLLHSFGGNGDGYSPYAGLTWEGASKLYGTTLSGGAYEAGTVFELRHTSGGDWKERILYDLDDSKGPGSGAGPLVFDKAGSLYGATAGGGNSCGGEHHSCGVVYKLSQALNGRWRAEVLHFFSQGAGGFGPQDLMARDKAGNLYGTAGLGGDPVCGCGTVYKLSPRAHGQWKYTVLHRFVGRHWRPARGRRDPRRQGKSLRHNLGWRRERRRRSLRTHAVEYDPCSIGTPGGGAGGPDLRR